MFAVSVPIARMRRDWSLASAIAWMSSLVQSGASRLVIQFWLKR